MAFIAMGLTSCGGGEKAPETKPVETESHEGHNHGHDHGHDGHDHDSHEGHSH